MDRAFPFLTQGVGYEPATLPRDTMFSLYSQGKQCETQLSMKMAHGHIAYKAVSAAWPISVLAKLVLFFYDKKEEMKPGGKE